MDHGCLVVLIHLVQVMLNPDLRGARLNPVALGTKLYKQLSSVKLCTCVILFSEGHTPRWMRSLKSPNSHLCFIKDLLSVISHLPSLRLFRP